MNNKGQSVLTEHVMVFFIVIAAIVAMTTFIQRSFQARIHDARDFMIDSVKDSGVCDANCLAATGNQVGYEYEPYYSQVLTDVLKNDVDSKGATSGSAAAIGAKYISITNEATQKISTSGQLPPECADGTNPMPAYCSNSF